jgi:outer membrane protein assembly factor BamB
MQRSRFAFPMRAFLILLPALGLLSACSACDPTTIEGCEASLQTDRRAIDFGRVYIGSSARETLHLTSPGCAGVQYSAHFELDAFGFQAAPARERIAANTGIEIVTIFRPGRVGPINGRLVFVADSSETASVAVELYASGAAVPDCEDGNGCTVDDFNLETGECEHRAERLVCDDFNACTGSDICVEGVCLGESFSCDDHDVCTDDLCDALAGCLNMMTAACSDGNPCTLDSCDPVLGCQHTVLDDGTPCNDLEQCTIGDICLRGDCIGVNVMEGAPCDDQDPCSKNDQCVEGTCLDPGYHRAGLGELKFTTEVGALAEGATENPLIDRDGTVFVGVEGGVTAIDRCGEVLWTNTELGTPRWSGAVSLPGILVVPVASKVIDIDASSGLPIREVDTAMLYSMTSSSGVRVLDMALRASGGLVVSVIRETEVSTVTQAIEREGFVAEIDPLHIAVTPIARLAQRHASRVAVDADEAVVAILRDDAPDKGAREERLVRFGLINLPDTTWASSPILARRSELAFGPGEEILWTDGLIAVSRVGAVRTLVDRNFDGDPVEAGSPVTFGDRVILVEHNATIGLGWGGFGLGDRLVALDLDTREIVYRTELSGRARRMGLAVDLAGNAFVLTHDGVLHALQPDGEPLFDAPLPVVSEALERIALGITPEGVVVAIAEGRVFGVQSELRLANSSWPRHRRDNLGTGHR